MGTRRARLTRGYPLRCYTLLVSLCVCSLPVWSVAWGRRGASPQGLNERTIDACGARVEKCVGPPRKTEGRSTKKQTTTNHLKDLCSRDATQEGRMEGARERARKARLGCQEMGHKLVLRTTPSTPLLRSPCLLVKEEEEEASRSSAQVQLCSLGLLWRDVGGRLAGMHHSAR